MREIIIGDKTIRVRATALALLYYRQAFKSDLIGDMVKMRVIQDSPEQFDSLLCLQFIWAMAKADSYGRPFPDFEGWIASLGGIDLSNPMFIVAALEEAADGFFDGGNKIKAK